MGWLWICCCEAGGGGGVVEDHVETYEDAQGCWRLDTFWEKVLVLLYIPNMYKQPIWQHEVL